MADWLQFGIVSIVVGAAAAYLARRVTAFVRVRHASECGGGCSGCPKSVARIPSDDAGPALVQLDGISPTKRGSG
jgi:hypothetical protein